MDMVEIIEEDMETTMVIVPEVVVEVVVDHMVEAMTEVEVEDIPVVLERMSWVFMEIRDPIRGWNKISFTPTRVNPLELILTE